MIHEPVSRNSLTAWRLVPQHIDVAIYCMSCMSPHQWQIRARRGTGTRDSEFDLTHSGPCADGLANGSP